MYTIVVADDEEEIRKAIINKIDWSGCGFQVVGEADNGEEAISLVETVEPDLLLTDIRMPFISGIELARQVREIRPSTYIAFLSGFDEFAYAQKAIEYNIISYMVKPISVEELEKELKAIKAKMDAHFKEFVKINQAKNDAEHFVMSLLLDGFKVHSVEETEVRLRKDAVRSGLIKEETAPLLYTVIAVSVFDGKGMNYTCRDMVHAIDTIVKKYMQHQSFYSNGRVISLVMGTEEEIESYLHILVNDIEQSIRRIMHLRSSIGISRNRKSLSLCHEAYREAVNAIGYSNNRKGGVHFISDEEPREELTAKHALRYVNEIEETVRIGSKEALAEKIKNMFDTIQKKPMSKAMMNFMLLQVFVSVSKIVYAVTEGESFEKIEQDGMLKGMTFYEGSIKEMEDKFTSFCMEAKDTIVEQKKQSSALLCEKTEAIIETDFNNTEISLVSVSRELGVSSNYLSQLLKKQTGDTFIELLTKKRMSMAKELLLCSSLKIREISERCGYNDQHYFSYCFKKYAGVSPNALRRQSLAKEI